MVLTFGDDRLDFEFEVPILLLKETVLMLTSYGHSI